ncbi:MAG: hypothetical protein CMC00_05910 [Flavobacteriaceae bacterium]|nr:hypothetical protein [Flavobacteriaceae bacterium]
MNLMNIFKKIIINPFSVLIIFLFFSTSVFSQDDLFQILDEESEKSKTELLPKRMIFTQRILWGEKGLMRKIKWSPLNIEQREKELRIRRKMLKAHQAIGFVTLAGFIAQGIIGVQLYNGNYSNYKFHKTVGHLTSISYFTGASLSLFSPPPLINKKIKGFSSAKAHKYLATVHFSSMVMTNIFSNSNRKLHKLSAYTAFGSYAAAILVFKF